MREADTNHETTTLVTVQESADTLEGEGLLYKSNLLVEARCAFVDPRKRALPCLEATERGVFDNLSGLVDHIQHYCKLASLHHRAHADQLRELDADTRQRPTDTNPMPPRGDHMKAAPTIDLVVESCCAQCR